MVGGIKLRDVDPIGVNPTHVDPTAEARSARRAPLSSLPKNQISCP
jgi:hypothetical protein